MMYDGWMWGNGWGWAGWVLFCVVVVLLLAAVVFAIVFAVRYAGGTGNTGSSPASYGPSHPDDVLAERYARGEIDEHEYRRRVALLHEHR